MADRLIIPAPPENTQESGFTWYEVTIEEDLPRAVTVTGLNVSRQDAASARVHLVYPSDDVETRMRPNPSVVLELGGITLASGNVWLFGRINGKGFSISDSEDSPTIVPRIEEEELRVLTHWSRLGAPLAGLAQATRNSWGETPCTMAAGGTTLLAAGCLTTVAATIALPKVIVKTAEPATKLCAGALLAGAGLYAECIDTGPPASPAGPASTPPVPPTITMDPPSVTIVEQLPVYIELDPPPANPPSDPVIRLD